MENHRLEFSVVHRNPFRGLASYTVFAGGQYSAGYICEQVDHTWAGSGHHDGRFTNVSFGVRAGCFEDAFRDFVRQYSDHAKREADAVSVLRSELSAMDDPEISVMQGVEGFVVRLPVPELPLAVTVELNPKDAIKALYRSWADITLCILRPTGALEPVRVYAGWVCKDDDRGNKMAFQLTGGNGSPAFVSEAHWDAARHGQPDPREAECPTRRI